LVSQSVSAGLGLAGRRSLKVEGSNPSRPIDECPGTGGFGQRKRKDDLAQGQQTGNRGHSEGGTGGGRKLGCCRQGGGSHAAAARLDPKQLRMALRGHRPDGLLPREASPAKVAKNGQHHDDDNDNPKPGRHVDPSFRGGCARPYDEGTPCTTSLAGSDWLDFEIGRGRQPAIERAEPLSLRPLVRPRLPRARGSSIRGSSQLGIVAAPPHLNDLAFFVTTCPPRRDVPLC
jgi:hypothetical protein